MAFQPMPLFAQTRVEPSRDWTSGNPNSRYSVGGLEQDMGTFAILR